MKNDNGSSSTTIVNSGEGNSTNTGSAEGKNSAITINTNADKKSESSSFWKNPWILAIFSVVVLGLLVAFIKTKFPDLFAK